MVSPRIFLTNFAAVYGPPSRGRAFFYIQPTMSSRAENNKRIAKNTLLLYVRMAIVMLISLYTSRVVLETLGVEDFGIYNVVGGVVAMFGFLNGAMSSATQRFITFALGRGDQEKLKSIFSTAVNIHIVIAVALVLLAETVGLWFLYNKLQIPAERFSAAFWVLQFSLATTAVMVASVPYNAVIVAHEKMSAFAYISILDTVLRLAAVLALPFFGADRLILYAFFLFIVQVAMRVCYNAYSRMHFPEARYSFTWSRADFKEMMSFAGWSLFGNLSGVLFTQGLNILLNMFFGPVVNAARGVAVQVQAAVQQLVSNFQLALNPQITKTYAQGDLEAMRMLMYRSSRFSFILLFAVTLPLLFEADFVLAIWLKTVPDGAPTFMRIVMCTQLLYVMSNPFIVANQATGKVRRYQVVCGCTLLCILPISYLALRMGFPPYSVFIVHFFIEGLTGLLRLLLLRPLIGLSFRAYFTNVYVRVAIVTLASVALPSVVYCVMSTDSWARFFVVGGAAFVSVVGSSFAFGMTRGERRFILDKVNEALKKLKV